MLLEVEIENVVVQIVRRKESAMLAKSKLRDLIRNQAVRVSVNDRDLVALGPTVRNIVSVVRVSSSRLVNDTRVLHL